VWNALKHSSTHRAASHSGHQNTVSFLLLFLYHTTHLFVGLAFFSVSGILYGKCLSRSHGTFLSVEWWPWNFLTLSLPCSMSSACTSSTLNLKWSIWSVLNLRSILPYSLELQYWVISLTALCTIYSFSFFPKARVEEVGLLDELHPCFRCNLELTQAFAFPVYFSLASFLFPLYGKLKSMSLVLCLSTSERTLVLNVELPILLSLAFSLSLFVGHLSY